MLSIPQLSAPALPDQVPPTAEQQLAALQQALAAAQAQLQAQNARFAALVNRLPGGVMLTTAEGRALATNQCCRDWFGLPTIGGADNQLHDIAAAMQHHFQDPAVFLSRTHALRRSGQGAMNEEFVLADGRVMERDYVVLDDEGHLISYRDVTALRRQAAYYRQRAEALACQLADQHAFYEIILNHLKVEVAVFDAQHRYLFANSLTFSSPLVREWVIGRDDFEYCVYRERPLELALNRRQLFEQMRDSGAEVNWEETLPSAQGPQHILRHFIPVLNADGSLRLAIGTGVNITQRRLAEEKLAEQRRFYEFVLDHMPCDVGVFDANYRYLFVNKHGIKDPTAREWVIGRDNFAYCQQYGHPLALAEERQARMNQALRERQVVTFEETFPRPEGTRHQLRYFQPVFHDDGTLYVIVAYSLDITERVVTEKALRHAKLAAESAVRARELFLANMSHEIRTPMNAILGMSQLLAKTVLAPDQHSYRQAITSSAEHLLVIVNDILDLSKLEAGKMALESVGFEPAQLLAEIEQTLHYKAVEKGLSLKVHKAAAVPAVLIGDPYRIRQVLLNLAGNAVKFTEAGQVAVSCELNDDGEVVFQVADTGIGIDPEFIQSLFKEFSQQDSSVTRRFGGTGLGLSISRNLLLLMGSDVQLESARNEGTVMRFALRLPTGTPADLLPKEVLPPGHAIRKDLQNKQVLLVEDNRFNRQIAKTFLSHAHVQVTEAENGALAVDLARQQAFDVILMDIQMPVMDGYAATALLRQQLGLRTPIVALTANAIKGEREKCLAAGMNDYLAKPFKEDELLKMVGKWVPQALPDAFGEAVDGGGLRRVPPALAALGPAAGMKLYATDELLKVGQGDACFVEFMLNTFAESCEEAMQDLAQGLGMQDVELLKTTAHTLRPSLVHLRALHLMPPVEALDKWEGAFEAEALLPLVDSIVLLLREVVAQVRADLPA